MLQSSNSFSENSIDLNVADANGNFPIAHAINSDNLNDLNYLIENGANVNINLGNGWTPLHEVFDYAIDGMIQNNRDAPYPEIMQMLKLLLENGADITLKTIKGESPLDSVNTYAADISGFNSLKDIFRGVIPDIDSRIQFGKKD